MVNNLTENVLRSSKSQRNRLQIRDFNQKIKTEKLIPNRTTYYKDKIRKLYWK